eukprot:1585440-Pyramimonas_sp.AAC.1
MPMGLKPPDGLPSNAKTVASSWAGSILEISITWRIKHNAEAPGPEIILKCLMWNPSIPTAALALYLRERLMISWGSIRGRSGAGWKSFTCPVEGGAEVALHKTVNLLLSAASSESESLTTQP